MLHCEAGKGSRYGGYPEERRVCVLKIIIDPRGEERLVWEWCFVFTVYKALEFVCFLFCPEWQPWEVFKEAESYHAHVQLKKHTQTSWLRPRSTAF